MALLEVEGVRAGYGETEVLHGVSLDVDTGEVVTIVGRNGVGKTTTLRSILGAVTPWDGTITYDGEEITGRSPETTVRAGIGYVPEERRIFPGLTVEENLRLGAFGGSDTENRRDIDDVLGTFENLRERRRSNGSDLSGGEQQMLAIARALVAGADLLMLDEPTEGLAPLIVERVVDLVREVSEEGVTVLLVEQNVRVALDLADRAYVLDRGEVVHEGTADALAADDALMNRHLGISL